MKILALITARGGSKRIPGKNIRSLGGKPLIMWSIDTVTGISEIADILVSTDDNAIAEIAQTAGALVPWLRPIELASDTASSVDVAMHALDWYEGKRCKVDGLLLLQPTSPFRSRETVRRGLELFRTHEGRAVIGVSHAESHPLWCFRLKGNALEPFFNEGGLHLRSQDLPAAYVVNGAFYLIAPNVLRSSRSFFCRDMVPLVIDDPVESIDIDTEWDWQVAEAALKEKVK